MSMTKTNGGAEKLSKTPSIIDQLSRTKTKEEIMMSKKRKDQAPDKGNEPTPEPPRGRDTSESVTTSTQPTSTGPKHPDDERPSMALAPKCTFTSQAKLVTWFAPTMLQHYD